jgi:membrane protein implicated in regulation of membrane protease activity
MIATDPLSLVFIACFLFGIVFLLATVLLGGIGDHEHGLGHEHSFTANIEHSVSHHLHLGGEGHAAHAAHPSHAPAHTHSAHSHTGHEQGEKSGNAGHFSFFTIINPSTIVFFLIGFGFFGYVLHNNTSIALPLILLLAVLAGSIIAAILITLINRIVGLSQSHTVQDISDRTGLLGKVIMTIKENSVGEILYESPGGLRKSIPARCIDGRRIERGQEVVVLNYVKGIAEVDTWEHFIAQEESETPKSPSADEVTSLRALLEGGDKTDTEYALRKDVPKE